MEDETIFSKQRVDPVFDDEQERQREQVRAFADRIARLLDSVIRVPGTSFRIGVDPILGLIPVLGDVAANLIGSTILFLAARLQTSKIVMVRMALNMGINAILGAVPGIGDLFSIWFRSNLKNAELLRRDATKRTTRANPGDWLFVTGLLVGTLATVIGTFALIVFGVRSLWNLA